MGIDHSSQCILTVDLPPEPDVGPELEIVAEVVRGEGDCDVIVNFSGVDIVTSSSISKLLQLNKLLAELGHRLLLCNVAPATESVFKVAGLDIVFEFATDEIAALAAIKHAQPATSRC